MLGDLIPRHAIDQVQVGLRAFYLVQPEQMPKTSAV